MTVSVSSLDQSLVRIMEPRSSSPQARLDTIEQLASAGIPVKSLVAPIIPGLTDEEIPAILQAVSKAGAIWAGYVVLRLPGSVEAVFLDWLDRSFPDQKEKIIGRIQSLRGGEMYDSKFGSRMTGQGIWADQLAKLFETFANKFGLQKRVPKLNTSLFSRPERSGHRQLDLF